MDREVIKVSEFDIGPLCTDCYWENVADDLYDDYFDEFNNPIKHHFSDDFRYVKETCVYYHLEKSYGEIETIVQRKNDGKYFKICWVNGYYNNEYPDKIEEVFPRTEIIEKIIYE